MINNQFRSLSEFYIINFLNKLNIVENTNKQKKGKQLKQSVGPWWCVHACKSYNCRLKQIQGSSQLEVVNSKCFFIF